MARGRLVTGTLLEVVAGVGLVIAPCAVVAQPTPTPPPCLSDSQQTFSVTATVQTYTVPAGASALLIVANGASGGGTADPHVGPYAGGQGAHVVAVVPVSSLPTLDVVVGQSGENGGTVGAGAGGGSFVYTPSGTLLVAAGGGGGAGVTEDGYDAELGTSGGSADAPDGGAGGTGGNGGQGAQNASNGGGGGGGGGFLSAGSAGTGLQVGQGGDRISSPGTAAGGAGGGDGGFGGGGGGGSVGGGGGGGYGGGGGGYGEGADGGGGGGSFVAVGGTTYDTSVLTATGDGSVTICAVSFGSIPVLSPAALALLALVVSALGAWVLARRS